MELLSENKQFNEATLINFLIFEGRGEECGKQTTCEKAVNSFVGYLRGRESSLLPNPETAVCDWTIHMYMCGISLKTQLPYLNAIAGLYKKAVGKGLAPATDIFASLRSQLKSKGDVLCKSWLSQNSFEHLRYLTRAVQKKDDICKLVHYSLTKGCKSLGECANVKADEASSEDLKLLGIGTAQFIRNRKYLFALDRSGITPAKLLQNVNEDILKLFDRMNICHSADADDTLCSYWAFAALRMGVAPHVVVSFLKTVPSGVPILSICKRTELTEEKREEIVGSTAVMFSANPPKWFVMRLRHGVKFENLEQKLTDLEDVIPMPELFYPCEEIYRRVNKKMTVQQKPVIPDIVFFKHCETDVYPMFRKIGDIAWGYKTDGKDGDRYAALPRTAFERFQEAIGQFTPDYQVAPIGEIPLKEGDTVVLLGTDFPNQRAEIQKIEKPDAQGRIIYRLALLDTGFDWTVSEDSRRVRKA